MDSADALADTAVAALFATRPYAYVTTDRHLRIQAVGGDVQLLYGVGTSPPRATDPASLPHTQIWEIAPELYGYEDEIQALLDGRCERLEIPTVDRSENATNRCYVTLVNVPQFAQDGQITGLLHCVVDISDAAHLHQRITQQRNELSLLRERLTRQNQELAAANAELQRLDEVKSLFVSIAAHELRTPLSSILGYTEFLQEDAGEMLPPPQQQYLDVIERNAKRLHSLANNLLDITRLEAGQLVLNLIPTDLLTLAENTVEQLQPTLESKEQSLLLDATPGLPPVLCDPERALQILTNLLSNASKYTPEQGTITLRLTPAATEGYVQVAIEDTGMGIPAPDQEQLFNRFFRASNAQISHVSGAGLGLYIVQMLVDLHGGTVWFESEVGCGTTFYVTFPSAHGDPQRVSPSEFRSPRLPAQAPIDADAP